ncbi:hypothetical protein AGMMS50229_16950 [Campylobacterota bacterium]|nr:hypothetical protein AGMMS50229_16950 [Campylobacterota bacterium]
MRLINYPFWALVRLYQKTLSPFVGSSCRFYPTCSNYALWSLEQQPLYTALAAIVWRILRCTPLTIGGIDYPRTHFGRARFLAARRSGFGVCIARKTAHGKIRWFFVPIGKDIIIIKALDGTDR